MEGLEACIKRPLAIVQDLFAQHGNADPEAAHAAIVKHFERVLAHPEALQQVPCLTAASADSIPSGTLVRFRGMVQDMLNPEYYLGAYQLPDGTWRTTQFSDQPPEDLAAARDTRVWERRPLYCTRVPSESAWAEARWTGLPQEPQTPSAAERFAKRTRQASEEPSGCCSAERPGPAAAAAAAPVGGRDQDEGAAARSKQPKVVPGGEPQREVQGRDQDGHAEGQEEGEQRQQEEQGPMPTCEPGDCIVYLHGEGEAFKLHDVVEVVGVVSVVPALAAAAMRAAAGRRAPGAAGGAMEVDGAEPMEADADVWGEADLGAHPPTSQALRLHAVMVRRVPPREPPSRAPASLKPEELRANMAALRARALGVLSAALGGDDLAAEYVLASALGCVHKRVDGSPHGHVHVNLTVPPDSTRSPAAALHAALSNLLPVVHPLPLTLAAANAGGWAPVKDHASGRLARGALQLPPGALLLVDETDMGAGALGERGIRGLQALARVLGDQQLPVDFRFYSADYPIDVAVVTVSRGRSLLRDAHHFVLPLVVGGGAAGAGAAAAAPAAAVVPPADLEAVRDYLSFARCLQCQLDEAAAERLAGAFVEAARAEPGFDMDRFNACVTLAKLLSLSAGQDRFDMSSWERAMQLEAARRQRMQALAAAQQQQPAQQQQQQPAQQQQVPAAAAPAAAQPAGQQA